MLSKFESLVIKEPKLINFKPKLEDFVERIVIEDDTWNKHKYSEISRWYYKDSRSMRQTNLRTNAVAYINYRIGTGQIGIFAIYDDSLRGCGLGKQILSRAVKDIAHDGRSKQVWASTTENHPFWSNVWGKCFQYSDPVDDSCSADGYGADIDIILQHAEKY